MRSSAITTFRAFTMLACAVIVPVLAIWGASWSEIVKKFQNLPCPAILNLASASTSTPASTARQSAPHSPTAESQPAPLVAPALPVGSGRPANPGAVPASCDKIQERLQKLARRTTSWNPGETIGNCIVSIARWPSRETPTTSTASRPPIPIPSTRCRKCSIRWRRGVEECATVDSGKRRRRVAEKCRCREGWRHKAGESPQTEKAGVDDRGTPTKVRLRYAFPSPTQKRHWVWRRLWEPTQDRTLTEGSDKGRMLELP